MKERNLASALVDLETPVQPTIGEETKVGAIIIGVFMILAP
jgi:hypothetical protein